MQFIRSAVRQYIISSLTLYDKFQKLQKQGVSPENCDNQLWLEIISDCNHRAGYVTMVQKLIPKKSMNPLVKELKALVKKNGWVAFRLALIALFDDQLHQLLCYYPQDFDRASNVRKYITKVESLPANITTLDLLE